jgi:multidrug resistance efflux pump
MRDELPALRRIAVSILLVAAAVFVSWRIWVYYMEEPWTRDGILRADVVGVAADVSGPVVDVFVHDTQAVRKGDTLFRIDPSRFTLALREATADLERKHATFEEADRETKRVLALTDVEVSRQQQQQTTARAIESAANYQQAQAARDVAQLNLDRSEVHASVNGILTDFYLRPGDYVTASQAIAALVDTDSFYVDGYFEETKLPRIHTGDHATIQLMGAAEVLTGAVLGIAGGVFDRQRSVGRDLLPNINPTFTWVRLAQRIPVRVRLDPVPPSVRLVSGRTATVTISPAPAK